MSENTLVAEGPGFAAMSGVKVLDPGLSAIDAASRGEWGAAILNVGAAAIDGVSAALDPVGTILSSGVGWLLDHFGPVQECLDYIAGNPSEVAGYALTWDNIGTRLDNVADNFKTVNSSIGEHWTGDASDARQRLADAIEPALRGGAETCRGMSQALTISGAIVSIVRGIVRDIVADLVGKLIAWAGQIVWTVGVGTAWVVPQATAAIAKWVKNIRGWFDDTMEAFSNLDELADAGKEATKAYAREGFRASTLLAHKPHIEWPELPKFDLPSFDFRSALRDSTRSGLPIQNQVAPVATYDYYMGAVEDMKE